jgi:hypothetical protein
VKITDVCVGGVYETRISGELVRVRVLAIEAWAGAFGVYGRRVRRCRLARCDNDRVLPKLRTPSALREIRDLR